ncbi:XRE family transcriptional regulator [Nocardioides aurantiacus]|uniref:XRE family transcriptional regulator n=1 Tax=Nocardioides aurantiacus TaxID=86796 RepID=UPI00403F9C64
MSNERLRTQMSTRRVTTLDVATALQVDPKTVERWVATGRVPHQRHRLATAELLGVEETYLWPQLLAGDGNRGSGTSEVVAVYPHRGAVPGELWDRLVDQAQSDVSVLVYSGLFLLDTHPDLPRSLATRAARGMRARFLYGNPDSPTVAWRGEEEGIGENLAARIRLALTYMGPAMGVDGIEIRQHESILYNSLYRFDDELLVNTHVMGSPAPSNPVLHLRRVEGGHLFDHYLRSFERVWVEAAPVERATAS